MINNKFVCNRQGCCCKNIKRNTKRTQEDIDLLNERGPVYTLINAEEMGLILYSFEKELLESIAKANNVKVDFLPSHGVIDHKRKIVLVIQYTMQQDTCPFLNENNLCNVYAYRPFICRFYPLGMRAINVQENRIDLLVCPEISETKRKLTNYNGSHAGIIKSLGEYFGYDIVAASEMENIFLGRILGMLKYFRESKDNPYFMPTMKPLKSMLPKLKDFKWIDFHIFIRKNPAFSEEAKAFVSYPGDSSFVDMAQHIAQDVSSAELPKEI